MNQTVSMLFNGKMTKTAEPRLPANRNFVIVCDKGDWSGFLTLAEAESKYPQLEKMNRPSGYFWVEER